MVKIKGFEFKEIIIRDSYNRKALLYKNKIIKSLKKIGLTDDDIEIPMERLAIRKAEASISWYMWSDHLFYSYSRSSKFVENLAQFK